VTQEEYSAVCPYLGLADDADSHATYATEAHRCYRLPNPTRIASPHQEKHCLGANHVACPVYLGEGVPQAPKQAAAGAIPAAAAAAAAAPTAATPEAPVRGPRPGQKPRPPAGERPKRATGAGTMGPRPRSGGISMPVMTIGLFALAIVVVALAFAIQSLVGGDDDGNLSPADTVGTAAALNSTRTAQAGGGQQTQPPAQTPQTQQANGTRTPGTGTQTPGTTRTPGTGTPPAGGGETYIVQAGDFCGTIAADYDITLQELLDANDMTEADCNTLQIGEELNIP
jgi:LysM repeat protein